MNEKYFLKDQKNSYQLVVDSIQDCVLIIQEGKIDFMNNICNKVLSNMYNIEDFFNQSFKRQIIENYKTLDKKIFKIYSVKEQNRANGEQVSSDLQSSDLNSIYTDKNTGIHNQSEYSLREIMIMSPTELQNKMFCFKDAKNQDKNVNKLLKSIVKGLSYVNYVDEEFLPTFKQFQIKKFPIYGSKIEVINPSFILCFVD